MPDWFYHPVARPILFCLPGETARRITMDLLATQARLPAGPAVFRALALADPPRRLRTEFAGLELPSPVGIGAGLDVDGRAAVLMQELGVGFLEMGPAGATARPLIGRTNPRRLRWKHGLATSGSRCAPAGREIAERLPPLKIPVGIQLHGERVVEAVAAVEERVAYITLSPRVGESRQLLREVRAATERPLMIRVMSSWPRGKVKDVVENARRAGIDGGVLIAGSEFAGLEDGEVVWNARLPAALSCLEEVAERLPTALSGGVLTPTDAKEAMAAGARALFLTEGLVFAGPGLPKRINLHLAATHRVEGSERKNAVGEEGPRPEPVEASTLRSLGSSPRLAAAVGDAAQAPAIGIKHGLPTLSLSNLAVDVKAVGAGLLASVGVALVAAGALYLLLASTVTLLPHETEYLGMSASTLCRIDGCRLADFIDHGRACYGGVWVAVGAMFTWLSIGPMRRSEVWSWWTLMAGGAALFGTFLSFLVYGYLDRWHAGFILLLAATWGVGLALAKPTFRGGDGPIASFRTPASDAWMWSPGGRGRLLVFTFALALVVAGISILVVADTDVFVSQDLAFIRLNSGEMNQINDRLLPLMAHDRSGFGGGLFTLGLLFCATAWMGIRTNARGAWRAMGIAGFSLMVPAFVAHMAVGYTSFVHLSPVYNGAILLTMALLVLRRTMTTGDYDSRGLPDV